MVFPYDGGPVPQSPRPPFIDIIIIGGLGLVMKTVDSSTNIWTVVNLWTTKCKQQGHQSGQGAVIAES